MINIGLTWQQSAGTAVVLAGVSAVLLRRGVADTAGAPAAADPGRSGRRAAGAGRFVREAALFFALFGLWQYAGSFSVLGPDGATRRGLWIWRAERAVHLPSEAAVQRLFLPHPLLVEGFNFYYDILHFPVLLGCLVWLFVRHRARYGPFRTSLVAFTGASLLIQLVPVAPPRLLPATGMVDTALRYGQSVYSSTGGFDADQLSAMPSVHVGWAILVAIAVIGALRSRWRWLALGYPALTTLAVVVTANHFWLDGVVAGLVLAAVLAIRHWTAQVHPAGWRIWCTTSAACRASRDSAASSRRPSVSSIWRSRS